MPTTTERLVELNRLRRLAKLPELKSWKKSKAALEKRIADLRKYLNMNDVTDPNNGCPGEAPNTNVVEFPSRIEPVQAAETPKPQLSTPEQLSDDEHRQRAASVIIPMIRLGMTNKQIYDVIMDERPELICVMLGGQLVPTKKWYIGWFRGDVQWQAKLAARQNKR